MTRRRLLTLFGSILLAMAVGIVLYLTLRQSREVSTLSMMVPWGPDSGFAFVEAETELFTEVNPRFEVDLVYVPLGDLNRMWPSQWPDSTPDVVVVSEPTPPEMLLAEEAAYPWTGAVWSLYVNVQAVQGAGLWLDGVPETWRSSAVTLEAYESWMAALSAGGVVPIGVGAQYTWPLAAWLQHIDLLVSQGEGKTLVSDDGTLSAAGKRALDRWRRWVAEGWVTDRWRREDWPASVQDLLRSECATVLLSSRLATSIPADSDARIIVVPFPRGGGTAWTVGSLWTIAVPADAPHPKGARRLYDFFLSQGVTQRLAVRFRSVFYSPTLENRPDALFASVTSRTDSVLMERLADFVSNTEIE